MKKIFSIILALSLCVTAYTAYAHTDTENFISFDGLWLCEVQGDFGVSIEKYLGTETVLTVPDSIDGAEVTAISRAAFYNSDIEKITLPKTVKTIGWWAFYGCRSLKTVSLNEGLSTISYGAFVNCPSLLSITVPYTVSSIGESAFGINCDTTTGVSDSDSDRKISTQNYCSTYNFSIIGYNGTYAQKYAEDNGFTFNSRGSVLFGDVDLNGVIDKSDTALMEKFLQGSLEPSSAQLMSGDVDGDYRLTDNDLSFVEKYIENYVSYFNFPVAENLCEDADCLAGKTMYCDGDSIASGTGTNIMGNSFYSYCNYIADKHNMTLANNAVAGTTLARREGKTKKSDRSILERVFEMEGSYDVILIDGGFNDLFQGIDLGEVTDANDRSGAYDEYTTAGALESICCFLNENYPDSVKLFVLCHERGRNPEQSMYWDIIRRALEKWDIDYIDFSEETDFSDVNDEISSQYFMYSEKLGCGDGIHPNRYAVQTLYGPTIDKKLNTLAGEKYTVAFEEASVEIGLIEYFYQYPLNAEDYPSGELKWSSDNEEVATVDEYGNVDAKGLGSTTIRVCTSDGKTAEYDLTVKLMAMNLEMDRSLVLEQGECYTLEPAAFIGTTANLKMYESSDDSVASVDYFGGFIAANKKGTATVTCRLLNGVVARCTVTVI